MPTPIPLMATRYGKELMSGTGFVVRREGVDWLVTCAHIVSTLHKTPNDPKHFADAVLNVFATDISIPLFVAGKPRISVVNNGYDGFLFDVLAVKLSKEEVEALAAFGAYDGADFPEVQKGDRIRTDGFPNLSSGSLAVTTLESDVDLVFGVSIQLSSATQLGMSGGPATRDGRLVGVQHADLGEKSKMTNGLVISLNVVGPTLF